MRKVEDKNSTEARELLEEPHAVRVKMAQSTLLAKAGAKCFQSQHLFLNKCQRNQTWLALSTSIFLIMGTTGLQLKV